MAAISNTWSGFSLPSNQGTKATVRVFFPDEGQAVFLSNPADASRHRCDWTTDEKCRAAVVLSSKIAKDFSVKNSESASAGHLKNPSRAYKECNAMIAKREGIANLILPGDVDEVLDLYSGGKNKNKRKRQLSDVKKATGVSRVEEYDQIDDKDIEIIGLKETYRISDPEDSKRIYLAARRTFQLAIDLGIEALLVDGNFGFTSMPTCTKKRAYQLFTIRVCCRNTSFLLMAALLPSKAASEYILLFEFLFSIFSDMNFPLRGVRIVSDWETGIIKAIRTTLPMATHQGCSFHALKCINNKISSYGLNAFARSHPVVRVWFNRIRASIFLPRVYIDQCGLLVVPVSNVHPAYTAAHNFLEYFKSEWMSQPEAMVCKFMVDRHRTTNLVESWHRGLLSHFLGHHPPLMELVKFLLNTELDDNISMKHYLDSGSSYELSEEDEKRSIETLAPMLEFDSILEERDPTNAEIMSYLDKMTKFCHEKLN
ncbi:hypothetical protein PMAYCL1PPCAC_15984 [Pristionchus mayeri]|uniref:MULE transposase domain-containing protein n=1 Tax=Pristionchus mayeri TaxID=1317129 RepID=A0AAN5CJY1_9BILA|nr:hypothetical protein PMAYCL1PPCAC_15984 [Pristionchus mayeri]